MRRQSFPPTVFHLEDGSSSHEAAAHIGGEGRGMFSSCSLEAADMTCLTVSNTPGTSLKYSERRVRWATVRRNG